EVRTFAQAVRLGTHPPRTTEAAQYALGFPVAAIVARGTVGAAELSDEGLNDATILGILRRINLVEDEALSARFPNERLARVEITLRDGTAFRSATTAAPGDPEHALSDDEVVAKFRQNAKALDAERVRTIERCVATLDRAAEALPMLTEAVLATF
ncbi:MAG: MmgE/PrpD family protein, partial [Alphaproteobacteria bacterium]|nr:MmgE/PrpD family protein [Alphaproteobacteria bacterium]